MNFPLSFAFNAEDETPESVNRRRQLANMIMGNPYRANNVGQGFNAMARGVVANVQNQRAAQGEQAGAQQSRNLFGNIASAFGGGGASPTPQAATPPAPPKPHEAFGNALSSMGQAFALSDRREKKDIKKRGEFDGMGIYEYAYQKDGAAAPKHVGLMAQEVQQLRPNAVQEFNGRKYVDYNAALQPSHRQKRGR